jgi:hypothetical protein
VVFLLLIAYAQMLGDTAAHRATETTVINSYNAKLVAKVKDFTNRKQGVSTSL